MCNIGMRNNNKNVNLIHTNHNNNDKIITIRFWDSRSKLTLF